MKNLVTKFVESILQSGFLAACSVLMNNALAGCRVKQLEAQREGRSGSVLVPSAHSGVKFLDCGAHSALCSTIPHSSDAVLTLSFFSRPVNHVIPPNILP